MKHLLALPYEVWRDIKGYEGLYQVSNLGRVKSLERYVKGIYGLRKVQQKIMSIARIRTNGYMQVHLTKNGIAKKYQVHRLVAEAFIPNPNNLPIVNHKDENKINNCVWNLEWCTYSYNLTYGNRLLKVKNTLLKYKKPLIA